MPVEAQAPAVNGVAAIVNDSIITHEDVHRSVVQAFDLVERQYARQPALLAQKKRELLERAIEELVERKLILHEFKTAGYNLPESVIESTIDDRIRRQFGDRRRLTLTLQEQGTTFENYRDDIRERIIVDAMRQKNLVSDLIISPHKIGQYYTNNLERYKLGDQVKLRMIFLDRNKHGANLKPLAGEVVAKLDAGVAFAEMAGVYSDGSQASEGGDWGWTERRALRDEIAAAAFALKAGQRSALLEQPEGCYILLAEETRLAHTRPLADVHIEIERELVTLERDRLNKQWIARLKSKSFVRYF
jgi:peptidyl-prolyl cis-trans isomerase SurA